MRDSGRMKIGKMLSFALMFMIIGTGLCVFGYAQGGNYDENVYVGGFKVNVGISGINIGRNGSRNTVSVSTGVDYYEEYEKLENLDINVGVCDIKIIDGDIISLEGTNISNNEFTVNYRSGKLTIKQKNKNNVLTFVENNSPKLILTIPSNTTLENVDLKYGVGSISIYDMKTENIDINVGVGSVKIDGLTAEKANIEGGVGSVTAKNLVVGKLDVEGGVGKTEIEECLVAGNITINGGVGSITLELLNKEDEFNFDISSGLGGVNLNGKSISKNYKSSSSSNEYKIKISSGVGSINILTE